MVIQAEEPTRRADIACMATLWLAFCGFFAAKAKYVKIEIVMLG